MDKIEILFNLLGVGTGNDTLISVSYYYRQCIDIPPSVPCTNGSALLNTVKYTQCLNCVEGTPEGNSNPQNNLLIKLQNGLFGGTNTWNYGATHTNSGKTGPDFLQSTVSFINDTIDFALKINKRYQIALALYVNNCYSTYYFECFDFNIMDKIEILFNLLGVGTGNDTLISVSYYYRQCTDSQPPTDPCDIRNPNAPVEVGQPTCDAMGEVKYLQDSPPTLKKSPICYGAYSGNLDHGCTTNVKSTICLKPIIDGTINCGDWCYLEKIDVVNTSTTIGQYFTLGFNSNLKNGFFTIDNTLQGPFYFTLKAANRWSAYYIKQGVYTGNWQTFLNDLSHSSLWIRCINLPSNIGAMQARVARRR
jgi:hypothetical protein